MIKDGQEIALFRALVDGERRDVLAVKNDRTAGYAVGRIAGDGIAQRRLAGAVGAHQHMGLILSHGQIHTVENFFFLDPHVQVLNL